MKLILQFDLEFAGIGVMSNYKFNYNPGITEKLFVIGDNFEANVCVLENIYERFIIYYFYY